MGCCADINQCPENSIIETNSTFGSRDCSAIGCLTELCPNGDIPPTPEGRCCPSALLCPRDNCDTVRCKVERCQDGSVAPVPVGQCCPDAFYCFDNIVKCAEVDCPLQYCPNGDLAPVPAGQCCPDPDLCPYKQCDHVTCIPEFCPTGQLAPIPVGQCCPKSDQWTISKDMSDEQLTNATYEMNSHRCSVNASHKNSKIKRHQLSALYRRG